MTCVKHRIRTGLALGLACAAAAPAAASARPVEDPPQAPATPLAPTVVRVMAPSGGFDWADAGIGAAGALALAAIAAGGKLAIDNRARPRARHSPATNS